MVVLNLVISNAERQSLLLLAETGAPDAPQLA